VIPDHATLAEAFSAFTAGKRALVRLREELDRVREEEVAVPADLADRVRDWFGREENAARPWDDAVRALVENASGKDG
jgi:hypothetical protein